MNQSTIDHMKNGHAASLNAASNYWNVVETFRDGEVAIEVSKSSGAVPKFGLRIGWQTDTRGGAWLPCGSDSDYTSVVERLLRAAQAYVRHELSEWQKIEDARQALRKEEDQKRLSQDAQKRERDAAKKRQYEQNKEQRRVENRARANGGGGGKKNK